jgi:hypothetical protein
MRSHFKIIHTSSHSEWGRIEKRIFNESVWMEQNEHKVIIIAPKDSPLLIKAKQRGFKVYGVEFKLFSRIKDYKLLKDIFYNEKPDILNTHGDKDSKIALRAAKNSGVPLRILSRHISKRVRNFWHNRRVYKKYCHYIFTGDDNITRHLQKVFKINGMQIFSMPDGVIMPDHEKTGLFFNTHDQDDPGDNILQTLQGEDAKNNAHTPQRHTPKRHTPKYHTIDTMGRDIIRIYSLHQVKLNPGTNLEYY